MKTSNSFKTMMVLILLMLGELAFASPTIDTINAQGYMRRANNTPITDGTYTMAFGVFENGTLLWSNEYSVTTTNGLFSQALSGLGGNLSGAALTAAGLAGNFTAVTMNPALLDAAVSGAVKIRVYAVTPIDVSNPEFDVPIGSVATAFIADIAKGVEAGSITTASIASSSETNVSAGAGSAGELVLLNVNGVIDTTMIPALPATQITSGSVGVANGGTGGTDAASARSGIGAAASGSNTDITGLDPTGTLAVGGAVTTTINMIAAAGGNGTIDIASSGSGTLTVGGAGTGNSTVGNTGAGSITDITGPTVKVGDANTTAVNVAPTGTNAAISVVSNGSGTLTVGGAGTGSSIFGNTGGASATTVQAGTGGISLSETGVATAGVTVSTTSNQNISLNPNGTGAVSVGGSGILNTATMNATTVTTVGFANNATSTTANLLAVYVNGTATVQKAATTTTNPIGIVVSGAGTTGTTAQIAVSGTATCTFDNTAVIGDFVVPSTTTAGQCHDNGTVGSFVTVGRVLTAGTTNQSVMVYPFGVAPVATMNVATVVAAYTPSAGSLYVIVEMVGSGGGGGGAKTNATTAASGGGAGAYLKVICPANAFSAGAVSIGTAGTAGGNTGTAGGAGGNVTLVATDGTLTAIGGTAGGGAPTASTNVVGGGATAVPTNGSTALCKTIIAAKGAGGGHSSSPGAVGTAAGGDGAGTIFGPGGLGSVAANAVGGNGVGAGSGGGGAEGAFAGGTGAAGQIVVTEFRAY